MARSAVLLLCAQAFSLAAAQPAQLTTDPSWTPVFVGETVTLTCRGPPQTPPGPTDWYADGRLWRHTESNRLPVSDRGARSYRCRTAGSELSAQVDLAFSNAWLVLQVPTPAVLEGDALSLRCRAWDNLGTSRVRFWRGQADVTRQPGRAELLLQPARSNDSGRYRCTAVFRRFFSPEESSEEVSVVVQELFSAPVLSVGGSAEPLEGSNLTLSCVTHLNPLRPHVTLRHYFYRDGAVLAGSKGCPGHQLQAVGLGDSGEYSCEVETETASVWKRSAPVAVIVRRVPVSGVALEVQPRGGRLVRGERLVLSCSAAAGTGPLSFSWHRRGWPLALASSPRHEIAAAQPGHGGWYHCEASNGPVPVRSPEVQVTVVVPVAGATITLQGTGSAVTAGDSLNLSCSVQAGTAPVAFAWLHDGRQLPAASGRLLALAAVETAHAGAYQCVASNQLNPQRVFRTYSRILTLAVTAQPHVAVAAGTSVSLLVLLAVTAGLGWHLRRRRSAAAAGAKGRGRIPAAHPGPSAPLDPAGEDAAAPEPEYSNVCPGAPDAGDVLYSTVTIQARDKDGPARPSALEQEPPVTYAVLPGPWRGAAAPKPGRLPSDSYENVPRT